MSRPRTIPDARIFAVIRSLMATAGEGAVSFGAVARQSGLAASTLVQRYGTRQGMLRAAALAAWQELAAQTAALDAAEPGAHGFLKALGGDPAGPADLALLALDFRDAELRACATAWRAQVEAALARRLGDAGAAAMLFAAWQGQMLWQAAGGKGFRLKEAARRLT
ncbi:MAG: hypothetical protein RIT14_397 [Pseudomonadota bacterium]|jgi:AcrR family transcriptional regulator